MNELTEKLKHKKGRKVTNEAEKAASIQKDISESVGNNNAIKIGDWVVVKYSMTQQIRDSGIG